MLSITGRNVNEVFQIALIHFRYQEMLIASKPRGERRLQYPAPVASTYRNPCERVLFSSARDCNPFFHMMDSLWMLAGRMDVGWLEQWLGSIRNYSDNGSTFHGAYGARLRRYGQMDEVLHRLRTEEDTTRAVLQIYDAAEDAEYTGKDMPCNCTLFFGLRDGKLNLTVANRSNDMIWGAYGANVVQFSMLQEYMAGHIGCDVGWYVQISNNAHIYPDNEATQRCLSNTTPSYDPYDNIDDTRVWPMSLGVHLNPQRWDHELRMFMQGYNGPYDSPFFGGVALPMTRAHKEFKAGNLEAALDWCKLIEATDWRLACMLWVQRRINNKLRKEQ